MCDERNKIYMDALIRYGDSHQLIVATEELAECIQAITKILRGGEDFNHLAEEVADAIICLEQVRLMFNIDERVELYKDFKIAKLRDKLKNGK